MFKSYKHKNILNKRLNSISNFPNCISLQSDSVNLDISNLVVLYYNIQAKSITTLDYKDIRFVAKTPALFFFKVHNLYILYEPW